MLIHFFLFFSTIYFTKGNNHIFVNYNIHAYKILILSINQFKTKVIDLLQQQRKMHKFDQFSKTMMNFAIKYIKLLLFIKMFYILKFCVYLNSFSECFITINKFLIFVLFKQILIIKIIMQQVNAQFRILNLNILMFY